MFFFRGRRERIVLKTSGLRNCRAGIPAQKSLPTEVGDSILNNSNCWKELLRL